MHVCRVKPAEKRSQGAGAEVNASRVSELLPFLEYDVHKQILANLKMRAHNAVFCLRTELCIGDDLVALMATGTSLLLAALPIPQASVSPRSLAPSLPLFVSLSPSAPARYCARSRPLSPSHTRTHFLSFHIGYLNLAAATASYRLGVIANCGALVVQSPRISWMW